MRATDLLWARPGLKAKDLISLLFGHPASARLPRIGARIAPCLLAPAWLPVIEISCQQIAAVVVDFALQFDQSGSVQGLERST